MFVCDWVNPLVDMHVCACLVLAVRCNIFLLGRIRHGEDVLDFGCPRVCACVLSMCVVHVSVCVVHVLCMCVSVYACMCGCVCALWGVQVVM